jgi:hypothetical protein
MDSNVLVWRYDGEFLSFKWFIIAKMVIHLVFLLCFSSFKS